MKAIGDAKDFRAYRERISHTTLQAYALYIPGGQIPRDKEGKTYKIKPPRCEQCGTTVVIPRVHKGTYWCPECGETKRFGGEGNEGN